MENKGKARIKVEFSRSLPFVQKNANFNNVDFQSRSYDTQVEESTWLSPVLVEAISDPKEKVFTIIPQKRKVYINNYIKGLDSTPTSGEQMILWKPLDIYLNEDGWGLIKDIAENYPYTSTSNPDGTCNNDGKGGGAGSTSSVTCSKWINTSYPAVAPPDDTNKLVDINKYISKNGGGCEEKNPLDTESDGNVGDDGEEIEEEEEEEEAQSVVQLGYVNQIQSLHGLFWGVESEPFLKTNMPFWVNIKRTNFSPSGKKHEGIIIISLGFSSGDQDKSEDDKKGKSKGAAEQATQQFDLILSENNKVELIDYWFTRDGGSEGEEGEKKKHTPGKGEDPVRLEDEESEAPPPPQNRKTFDSDIARVLREQKNIEVGFMTVAGRLVIFINGETLIYNRIGPSNDQISEVEIPSGAIRVYGTNHQTAVNVSLMSFAEMGAFSIKGPSPKKDKVKRIGGSDGPKLGSGGKEVFNGIRPDGTLGGSSAELPASPEAKGNKSNNVGSGGPDLDTGGPSLNTGGPGLNSAGTSGSNLGNGKKSPVLFGVDSETFTDDAGKSSPTGFGFHQQGEVCFKKAGKSSNGNDAYLCTMKPSDTTAKDDADSTSENGDPITIPNGGCPYFFRLQGAQEDPNVPEPNWQDISEDVQKVSETEGIESDYTVGIKSGTVTVYNKNGKYDSLKNIQCSWRLYFSWCDDLELVFTGLNVASTISEEPGNETITFQLKDFNEVLRGTPILNSPIMDGMFSYSAIELVAKKAGVLNPDYNWPNKKAYFLPEGGSPETPSVKFEMNKSIYDCMVWIAQKDQSNFYFSPTGRLTLRKIPGGIFSEFSAGDATAVFTRNPLNENANLIIEKKDEEFNIASTVSEVNVFGMRKDLKTFFGAKTTPADVDPKPPTIILYTKRLFLQQQALQDNKIAKRYALELGKRVFWPIRRISFQVVGFATGTSPNVLDMVLVDRRMYRLKDIQREYDANSNSYTVTLGCEWKGGGF